MSKKIEIRDFYDFTFLSNISFSPDGKSAVFFTHQPDEKKNAYKTRLWLLDVDSGKIKPMTAGCQGGKLVWLDNENVLFSSVTRDKVEKGHTRFYRLPITGGEATLAFDIPERVDDIRMIDRTRYLVLCKTDLAPDTETREFHAKKGVDYEIFDELPFWANGKGVVNKQRRAAKIFDSASGELTAVTVPEFDVAAARLSPGRDKVLYSGCVPIDGPKRRQGGLWLYDITTRETRTLVPQGDMGVGNICFMSGRVFFTGQKNEFPGKNPGYYTVDLQSGEVTELPFPDAEVGGGVGTDSSYGGGRTLKYSVGRIYMLRTLHGDNRLVSVAADGSTEVHMAHEDSVSCFDVFGRTVLFIGMRDMRLPELYSLDLDTGEQKRLSGFNEEFFQTHEIVKPETFTFKNSDGWELDGYVLKPAGYQPGKKYPGVLEIHGGPKAVFGTVYHHEMQILAARGYFVFYTNPRGSDGRGEEFANITGKLGTIDYQDLMELTDEVVRRYPDLDENRMACCGGSYGGFMVNWMIGHTDRFKAACAQRSISNYMSKCLTTDIGYYHNLAQMGTDPWKGFDAMWESSPLKCAHKAKTPTLFIQSDEDYRCWLSEPLQMFTALRRHGVDSRIALFKGENHELSRSGKPKNRMSRLEEIAGWFDKHLK